MLARSNLVIKHLPMYLRFSAAATITVCLSDRNEHQEVNYEARDYQLDQGADH